MSKTELFILDNSCFEMAHTVSIGKRLGEFADHYILFSSKMTSITSKVSLVL